MVEISVSLGRSRVHGLFGSRALVPATTASPRQAWLDELSAPVPLAKWASGFADLKSCWRACRDPEWLVWLAARGYDSAEQRKQVVLYTAELASMAQRGRRETDPRVTRAISLVQSWAETELDALDLLSAQCDALDAAREFAEAADCEAERALARFRAAPRRRPSSYGMSGALGSWQRWRELERDRCTALAAALAVSATMLPEDATLTFVEWANGVSRSVGFAMLAMSTPRPSGDSAAWLVKQRSLRLARRRLACPEQVPTPAAVRPPGLDDGDAGAGRGEAGPDDTESRAGADTQPEVLGTEERARVAVPPQGQAAASVGGDSEGEEGETTLPEVDQRTAAEADADAAEIDGDVGQVAAKQPGE